MSFPICASSSEPISRMRAIDSKYEVSEGLALITEQAARNSSLLIDLSKSSFFFFKQKTAYEILGVQTCALPISDSHPCPRLPAIDEVFTTSAFLCAAPASWSIDRHSR